MNRPRALVVRSGANPFGSPDGGRGVEIVERVSHRIEPVDPGASAFSVPADLVILTSRIAAQRVLEDPLARDFRRCIAGARIVAVGPATERSLIAAGLPPDLVAKGFGSSLLDALPAELQGRHVLFPCGEDASLEVAEGLRARGANVTRVVVYRKVPSVPDRSLEQEILERPFAAFCATSPSAARWLFESLNPAAARRLRDTPAVVLGPLTRRCLESQGVRRIEVADEALFAAAARLLETLATATAGK